MSIFHYKRLETIFYLLTAPQNALKMYVHSFT